MTKEQIAEELFTNGYNCSQAVVCAFEQEIGLPREQLLKLAASFGGGMGGLREVCGAVSGMFITAGFLYGYDQPDAPAEKAAHYARITKLAQKFQQEHGTIICRELLGYCDITPAAAPAARTPQYYKERPCAKLVACAAKIMREYIEQNPISKS